MITQFNKYILNEHYNSIDVASEIVIKINNKDEFDELINMIKTLDNKDFSKSLNVRYSEDKKPYYIFFNILGESGTNGITSWFNDDVGDEGDDIEQGNFDTPSLNGVYDKIYTIYDLNTIKNILNSGRIKNNLSPNYSRRKFITENILLEKSSLSKLGVPREVMQPIQEDLAISDDAEWEKIEHKKDIVQLLRKGDRNLFIQVAIDNIKIIVSYPSPKGTMFFVDNYIYRDTDWAGEFEKLKREYKTITQTVIGIDPKANIYRLSKGNFTIDPQKKRKMIKKEESFIEFSENFKTTFLKKFDKILKRVTKVNYKKAKKDVIEKAKKIAMENNLLIKGLDNPLSGPNGLTILDEFLYQFEDVYSEYFGERIDLQELSNYFTIDKVMTMFMYYIYTGKILSK